MSPYEKDNEILLGKKGRKAQKVGKWGKGKVCEENQIGNNGNFQTTRKNVRLCECCTIFDTFSVSLDFLPTEVSSQLDFLPVRPSPVRLPPFKTTKKNIRSPSSSRKWWFKIGAICFVGLLLLNFLGYDVNIRLPIQIKSIKGQSLAEAEHERDIFDESIPIAQNDIKLLTIIRNNHLIPPSKEAYNLEDPKGDPSKNEGQNQYVLKILNNMTGGFFVECGAWDGERLSTTLVLERDLGWTGFLAEPNTESFAKLRTKNRKAWIANICLSTAPHPQLVSFGEVHQGGFLPAHSSIQKYLSIKKNVTIIRTPCFPIFSVLSAIGVTTVDFFTLDIEGAELDVLKTIPFDSILIKIFCIEWNHVPEGKEELRRFVESKGYKLVKDIIKATASDYIFVHESVPLPPTVQLATV